jgi:hypothetical protein
VGLQPVDGAFDVLCAGFSELPQWDVGEGLASRRRQLVLGHEEDGIHKGRWLLGFFEVPDQQRSGDIMHAAIIPA